MLAVGTVLAFRVGEVNRDNLYGGHVQTSCDKLHIDRALVVMTPVLCDGSRSYLGFKAEAHGRALTKPRIDKFLGITLLLAAGQQNRRCAKEDEKRGSFLFSS